MAESRISTAGIKLLYAVGGSTRPVTGYKEIPETTDMPATSAPPETVDATPLSAKKFRIPIPTLIDIGGSLAYTANFSQTELNIWNNEIVQEYKKAVLSGNNMWFCIVIPGFSDALYYTGIPTKIGGPAASVGEVLRITLPITPSNEPDWYPVPVAPSIQNAIVGYAVVGTAVVGSL